MSLRSIINAERKRRVQRDDVKPIFQPFDASSYRVGIVVAQFNGTITEPMLKSAQAKLAEYHVPQENITVLRAAGCIEIPVVLQSLAKSGKVDCLVALGAIVRGDTVHFEYVAKMVSEGILRVMLDHAVPVGFGILTLENEEQAQTRLNSGAGAVEAALQSAYILKNGKNA